VTVVAIIAARMGSSRFPGKVLAPIAGKPLLFHVVDRVRAAALVDQVVVATPLARSGQVDEDLAIAAECSLRGVECYASGSGPDVLSRIFNVLTVLPADIIVRVTSDCPLVPSEAIDQAVEAVQSGVWDYVTNAANGAGWSDGEDVEAFTRQVFERLDEETTAPEEREHVTLALRRRGFGFRCGVLLKRGGVGVLPLGTHTSDWSKEKLSIDTPDDLARIAHRL
jgi:spore coat polysaccharide biosynthesis protein SpsF (cytidylyltransferase family)